MLILMILFVLSGMGLSGLSVPMILGKVPPNRSYGFRVKQTLENPAVWYAVNTYSGKWLLAAGLCLVAAALIFALIPGITVEIYSYCILLIWSAVFAAAFVASIRYLNS